jgi:hypothetical protein
VYGARALTRILTDAQRAPTSEHDGIATWSLSPLKKALRQAPDGLPPVSTYTLWIVLHEAGYSYRQARAWCATGTALRKRKAGAAPSATRTPHPKKLIEDAYLLVAKLGLSVWRCDQAGPFQAVPHPGPSWRSGSAPARQPHEYVRNGTAKVLTLFHPADGQLCVEGVTACPNRVLPPWPKRELSEALQGCPPRRRGRGRLGNAGGRGRP